MKTIIVPTIYLTITAAINIALVVLATILYHRHMRKEIAKQKRRLERRRGVIYDHSIIGELPPSMLKKRVEGWQPLPTKTNCKPPRKP